MRYTYPMISTTLTYKRIDRDTVEVTDLLNDTSFEFDIDSVRYFRQLDGRTHPYRIKTRYTKDEVRELLGFLREYDLLRYSDTTKVSAGMYIKTVWIPKPSNPLRVLAYFSNLILMILWLPVLLTGILLTVTSVDLIDLDLFWIGFFPGLIASIVFHEFGHAFAGISYGAPVYEMGLMMMFYILPGAYVLLNSKEVRNKMKRVQISAAGIEANFLLCGISLILSVCIPNWAGLFFGSAIVNVFTALLNLTFISGFDGTAIISELLGTEQIVDRASEIVKHKEARKRMLRQGATGYAVVGMSYCLFALQVALPILLIMNIAEVIRCFV